jgi:ribonuclease E
VSSVALQLLRSLDEMLLKGATHNLTVRTRSETALYLLNHKRTHLHTLEERFRIAIIVNADPTIAGQLSFVIEKGEQVHTPEQAKALALQPSNLTPIVEEEDEEIYEDEAEVEAETETGTEVEAEAETESEDVAASEPEEAHAEGGEGQDRKRRRRRRGRRPSEGREGAPQDRDRPHEPVADLAAAPDEHDDGGLDETEEAGNGAASPDVAGESNGDAERRRRRRGRRGGRRNRRGREGEGFAAENGGTIEPELAQAVSDFDGTPVVEPEPPAMHTPIAESRNTESRSTEHRSTELRSDVPLPAEAERREERPAQVPQTMPSEPPRRRSTVREPVPQAFSDQALGNQSFGANPAPAPVPPTPTAEPIVVSSSAESEADDRPRRAGWWSKRALGKG